MIEPGSRQDRWSREAKTATTRAEPRGKAKRQTPPYPSCRGGPRVDGPSLSATHNFPPQVFHHRFCPANFLNIFPEGFMIINSNHNIISKASNKSVAEKIQGRA